MNPIIYADMHEHRLGLSFIAAQYDDTGIEAMLDQSNTIDLTRRTRRSGRLRTPRTRGLARRMRTPIPQRHPTNRQHRHGGYDHAPQPNTPIHRHTTT